MNIQIPDGLGDMLREFTVSVIRANPSDLYDYAVDYFTKARRIRKEEHVPMYITVEEDDHPGEPDPVDIIRKTQKSKFVRRASVSAEHYDPEADDDDDDVKVVYPKTDKQRERLAKAVSKILIFKALDADQKSDVIDAMFEKNCQANDIIIKQNDDADNFYVIDSGSYAVSVIIKGKDKHLRTLHNEGSFGELALMYSMPRSATIKAMSDGKLWAMDRISFRRIVLKAAFKKRKLYDKLLENVSILESLEPYERMNLADSLSSKEFKIGKKIIAQGEKADGMYFIEKGQVEVIIRNHKGDAQKTVAQLTSGQYFGELSLINNKPRSASVVATSDVKVAFLERESFERLLGPCLDIMKRKTHQYKTYDEHLN